MEIISVIPRGYCQGVVRAIQIAKETAETYKGMPITMLGMIVHNSYVVEACRKAGINFIENSSKTRLELLDEINEGVVIFTAHGVSDAVRQKAIDKGLIVVDATCRDVARTHTIIQNHQGDIIYIGKKNHPEAEAAAGLSERVHLVTSLADVDALPPLQHVLITNQTTLSILDTKKIIERCLEKYPDASASEEICNATRIRQEAVMKLKDTDLLIVVGDPRSNNSRQLAETGKKAGIPQCLLISSVEDLSIELIKDHERIAVTSGSSTPNALTKQVIDVLQKFATTGVFEQQKADPAIL